MILANVEIQRALDEGRLIIRPEPSPRQPPANGVGECPYNTTSVDLRLGATRATTRETGRTWGNAL